MAHQQRAIQSRRMERGVTACSTQFLSPVPSSRDRRWSDSEPERKASAIEFERVKCSSAASSIPQVVACKGWTISLVRKENGSEGGSDWVRRFSSAQNGKTPKPFRIQAFQKSGGEETRTLDLFHAMRPGETPKSLERALLC